VVVEACCLNLLNFADLPEVVFPIFGNPSEID
jgi:hypothetical protein